MAATARQAVPSAKVNELVHKRDDHDDDHAGEPVGLDTDTSVFNMYNTEIVKFDARSATMTPSGDLIRQRDSQAELDELEQFGLVAEPEYSVAVSDLPSDSVSNKSFTDVTFIVGPPQHSKKYVGHRVLLAMTSPVFEAMFYGDMADKSKYIRIADVAPIGFENLLRYAYTDSLNLGSVEDAMLTAYAAKKYLLPQLLRECLTYIEHNIGPASACVVFEFAHVLNSQQLVLQAMNLIDRQTSSVLASKTFQHVQASTVEFLTNRKYLTLPSELALFTAVCSWALAELRRRQLPPLDSGAPDWLAARRVLSEEVGILGAVRFLAMSQEEFARAVARTSGTIRALSSSGGGDGGSSGSSSTRAATDGSLGGGAADDDQDPDTQQASEQTSGPANQLPDASSVAKLVDKVNPNDPNSLLTDSEQRAVFLNLALGQQCAQLPSSLSSQAQARQAPPEYFTLRRFSSTAPNLIVSTTTTRSIKSISSKFQCLSENVFIVGLTIPIRLDASSYANRTPKFECHLKFTTKTTASSCGADFAGSQQQQQQHQHESTNGTAGGSPGTTAAAAATLLMDTIDESLHISIARDKDCLVRLKRPILIRMGNVNELTLTFQTYALDEDIVALRTPRLRSANFSEQTDGENISWLFFKSSNIEFSELHYYY